MISAGSEVYFTLCRGGRENGMRVETNLLSVADGSGKRRDIESIGTGHHVEIFFF